MGQLIYSSIISLDGYVADAAGTFAWAMPDEEVHAAINDQERLVGICLYGRRMYETLVVWETMETADEPAVVQDYALIWRAADKVVYSRTLGDVASARTRVMRSFDLDEVRQLVAESDADVSIGGPGLASQAIVAGLIDEMRFVVVPVIVGGGTRCLPDGVRIDLELVDERRFGNGMVGLHYRSTR